jgi:tetratricopeptide (TPR) repeat protein
VTKRRFDIRSAAVLVGFITLTCAVYFPALRGEFVSDDLNAIVLNEHVQSRASAVKLFTTFSWWGSGRADAPGYRPLTTWTFARQRDLAGMNTTSWHAVNLVLHGVVSWLVFLVALELGTRRPTALWTGGIFCLLPIHSEAVAWVVGRAELLAAIGYGAALLFSLRYRRHARARYAVGAAVALAAGAFAKESAVTVLAVPILCALFLPGGARERRRDAVIAGAMAGGFLVYVAVRATAGGTFLASAAGDQLDNPLAVVGVGTRLLGAVAVLGRYIALTVWPHPLAVDYSFDALGIGPGFIADRFSAIAIMSIVALAVCSWKRGGTTAFALLLAASAYSLVSNTVLLIGTVMAERLLYIPTIGLVLAAAPGLDRLLLRRKSAGVGALVLATVCGAYAVRSMLRAHDWKTPITLFESAVKAHPRSARAHMELASAYGRTGDTARAEVEFAEAIRILPSYAAAWYNLGNARARRGALDPAADAYRHAVEHAPRLTQAWYNLALVEQMRGHRDAAIEAFAETAKISPRDPLAHTALGDALLAAGRLGEAVDSYTRAIEIGGDATAGARLNRGVALERSRGCEAALPDYLATVEFPATRAVARRNAAACLRATGREEEARRLTLP